VAGRGTVERYLGPHRHCAIGRGRPKLASLPQRMLDPSTYRCSSPSPAKRSPLKIGLSKRPAFGRFCWMSLMVQPRKDTPFLSLNGVLSPKLGSRRIYSTSFFCLLLSSLAIYRSTKVRDAFAWRSASTTDGLGLQLEEPSAPSAPTHPAAPFRPSDPFGEPASDLCKKEARFLRSPPVRETCAGAQLSDAGTTDPSNRKKPGR
jgi:hypothetical protein